MTGHGTQVISNVCRLNKSAGIGLASGKTNTATLTGNRLLENAAVALGVNAGWNIAVTGNELTRSEGLPPLVMVAAGTTAAFTNNVLRGGGVASLRLAGDVRAVGNQFIALPRKGGPPGQAVWALAGSSVELVGNRFEGWRSALVAGVPPPQPLAAAARCRRCRFGTVVAATPAWLVALLSAKRCKNGGHSRRPAAAKSASSARATRSGAWPSTCVR